MHMQKRAAKPPGCPHAPAPRPQVVKALAPGLDIRLGTPVASIEYALPASDADRAASDGTPPRVRVTTTGGEAFEGALALVTMPLGVLKSGTVQFDPPLPDWKSGAVARLGFGDLNKVILQVGPAARRALT
jgi:lysine-specific histone demethylase 1